MKKLNMKNEFIVERKAHTIDKVFDTIQKAKKPLTTTDILHQGKVTSGGAFTFALKALVRGGKVIRILLFV